MALQKALKSVCEVCPGFPNQPLSITSPSSTTESSPSSSSLEGIPTTDTEGPPGLPNEPLATSYYYRYSSVSAPSQSISPLESLPRELVWRILDQVPECLREVRATSQTMLRHVADYSMRHPNQPIIQYLRITQSPKHNLQVELTIPRSAANIFELRVIGNSSLFSQTGRVRGAEENKYYVYFLVCSFDQDVLDQLSNYMGKVLDKVEILDWKKRYLFYFAIARLLESKDFGTLDIKFEALSQQALTELIRPLANNKTDKFNLSVRDVIVSKPERLLVELSTLFQSISITQLNNYIKNIPYFFGLHHFEWSPIILEMFSGKMDKLYISNFHYPQYLSTKSAVELLEKLPLIEKKVWFVATYKELANAYAKHPDFFVRGNLGTDGYFLKIKHPSRLDE